MFTIKLFMMELVRLWDFLWFQICVWHVRLTIRCQNIPVVDDLTRRLSFLSGSADTNANLCLFLRNLYTLGPKSMAYDEQEQLFGQIFLERQYLATMAIIRRLGLRLLPPLLRPLYVSYHERAHHAFEFVMRAIQEDSTEQIIILGSGFDSTAYRTRKSRLVKEGDLYRLVQVYEVDRQYVQDLKLKKMREKLSQAEYNYYTEGVHFVPCEFGVDSIDAELLSNGFDPTKSTAIIWEGVTYYLTAEALLTTIFELRRLFTPAEEDNNQCSSSSAPSTECGSVLSNASLSDSQAVMSSPVPHSEMTSGMTGSVENSSCTMISSDRDEAGEGSITLSTERHSPMPTPTLARSAVETKSKFPTVRIYLDYMSVNQTDAAMTPVAGKTIGRKCFGLDSSENSENEKQSGAMEDGLVRSLTRANCADEKFTWVWSLMADLAESLGTSFRTGLSDAETELEEMGIQVTKHIKFERVVSEFLEKASTEPYYSVFFEDNALTNYCESSLGLIEGIVLPLATSSTQQRFKA